MQKSAEEVLREDFGLPAFRGEQQPVIERTLEGENSLVLMPTGMGKSLCYQLPAKMFPGLTLVVSPLIALMKDQVQGARERGLRAAFINSSLSRQERERHYRDLADQKFELLYVAPERFRKKEFLEAVSKNQISLLAVDEAHCISQWGHDFRPDYTRIAEFREHLGFPPTLALTATATPEVQEDIVLQCGLKPEEMQIFHGGMERSNLQITQLEVVGLDEKIRGAMAFLSQPVPGTEEDSVHSSIIYFSLIETLEKFSFEFRKLGIPHGTYHGRMDARSRRRSQEKFMASEVPLILATPAFGLGVDKRDIRRVLHAEVPGSIEAYYQEIGRAGRDGKPAECILFYDGDDVAIQMDFIKWSKPDPGFIRSVYRLLSDQPDKVKQEGFDFLRTQMNFYNRRDFRVETAVNLLERWDSVEGDVNRGDYRVLQEPPAEYLEPDVHAKNLKKQQEKLLDMVNLVKQAECRKQVIYRYFGLPAEEPCGFCDLCLKRKAENTN